jgi:two-component system phosphate regulon sensor histidine kinase PhoR
MEALMARAWPCGRLGVAALLGGLPWVADRAGIALLLGTALGGAWAAGGGCLVGCIARGQRLLAGCAAPGPAGAARRRPSGASSATASSAAAARREQAATGRSAAPAAVPVGDRGLAQWRAAARRQEQIDWCNRVRPTTSAGPGARPRQRVTNLVRAPAFVAYLQAGRFESRDAGRPDGRADAVGAGAALWRRHALVLSQDITERERADAMRRDFVANVSHEIRTPLTVLAGFVETMATLP